MRVTIFTEAGEGVGWGHVSRCAAVAQAFEEKGHSVELVAEGIENVNDRRMPYPGASGRWTDGGDGVEEHLRNADAAIIDSYRADARMYALIAARVGHTACFDDTNRLDYPADIVINGSVGVDKVPYNRKKNVEYLLGPDYAPLRSPFWDVVKKEISNRPREVIIYLSENDPRGLCGQVSYLVERVLGECRISSIASGTIGGWTRDLKGLGAEEMKSIMMEADLAVAAGGQILYELARIGVPTIAVGLAENQRPNIEGWERLGFIKFAGWWDDSALMEKLDRCIEALKDRRERELRSRIGRSTLDGQGARRIRDRMELWG
jgi:spore coat polysaccharide biosynthesis predicted glycosyltransferase SpsG